MTIVSTNTVEQYTGNGTQTEWPVTFPFLRPEDVRAVVSGTGGDRVLAYGTDYVAAALPGGGGSVITMPGAPGAPGVVGAGEHLTLWLDQPFTQEMDLRNTGVLDAEMLEHGFDRLTLMAQQLREEVGRCVKVPLTDQSTRPDALLEGITANVGRAELAALAAQDQAALATDCAERAETAATSADAALTGVQQLHGEVIQAVADAREDVAGSAAFVPIGAILDFPVNTVPAGFLVCAGQVVTRAAYPELVTYLTGGPEALSATLPDYRGTLSRAADLGRGLAPDVVVGGYLADAFQGHWHSFYRHQNDQVPSGGGQYLTVNNPTIPVLVGNGVVRGAVADGVNGTPRVAAETRGKSYGVVRCIKAYHAPMGAEPVDIAEVMDRLDAMAAVVSPEVGRFCLVGATTSGQSFPANVNTTVAALGGRVQFGGEAWPDAGDGSLSIIVPEAGTYEIEAKLTLLSGTNSSAFAWISVNGSLLSASIAYAPTTYWTFLHPRVVRTLAAGDIVRIVTQSTATTQSGSGGTATLTLQRVR
ncbi:tail fiber protein [Nitratidesulfovibrio sp.]|uniref:tail fiber protein n=1 Tax=Nitratidesulfovibrio sp. TaxID=2802297 RepID=UPI0033422FE4